MARVLTTVLLICLMCASGLLAQAPDTVWTRLYGGDYSEIPFDGIATCDDCFILTGYTSSWGAWNCDGYLVKFDENGDTLWTAMIGAPQYDYLMDIVEASDSGVVVAGKHDLFSGDTRRCWLAKFLSDGSLDWEHNFQAATGLETFGVTETADSGFAITGYTGPYGNYDFFLMRTDKNGDSLWIQTYGGAADDKGVAIAETADSGFIIAGISESFDVVDEMDLYVVRTDKNGDTVWTRTFGHSWFPEYEPDMIKNSDGNYVILTVSQAEEVQANSDFFMVCLQDDGDTLWTKHVNTGLSPSTRDIAETSDQGYLLTGSASYGYPLQTQVYVVKLDAAGDTLWTTHVGDSQHDVGYFAREIAGGDIIIGAGWGVSGSNPEFYAIRLSPVPAAIWDDQGVPTGFVLNQNYPNPFNPSTVISFSLTEAADIRLEVYNVLGRKVATLVDGPRRAGLHAVAWNGTDDSGRPMATGVYLYRLSGDDITETRKMILIK